MNLSFNANFNLLLTYVNIGLYIAAIAYLCHTIVLACCCFQFYIGYDFNKASSFKCKITSFILLVTNYFYKNLMTSAHLDLLFFDYCSHLNVCYVLYVI